jgi:hypothetical protein
MRNLLEKLKQQNHVTTTENIGRAMIRVAANRYSKRVLENIDINMLGET